MKSDGLEPNALSPLPSSKGGEEDGKGGILRYGWAGN